MSINYPIDLIIPAPHVQPFRELGYKHLFNAVPAIYNDHVAIHRPSKGMVNFPALPKNVRHAIIAEVVSTSPRRHLPRYATISKEWQKFVERVTFAELYLTDGRVTDFGKIMNRRRQSNLGHIMCHVMLGLYASHNIRETVSQHRESNQVLNDYISELFNTMSKWRVEDAGPAGVQLKIVISSPSDESSRYVVGDHRQNKRARAALAKITIPSDLLPTVPVISGLACTGRHLELSSVTLLATKLPNLRTLDAEMEHDTRDPKDVEQRAGKRYYCGRPA